MQRKFKLNYRGEFIELCLPLNWSHNIKNVASYIHHLVSLRWIDDSFDDDLIIDIIEDFYNFHIRDKEANPYYFRIEGDHANVIRLYRLEAFLNRFEKNPKALELIKKLIRADLSNLSRKNMYRKGHNHGLMSDECLLHFALKEEFRKHINILTIIQRAYKTFHTMWNEKGETKEHSITYQEFNLQISMKFIATLNVILEEYPFALWQKIALYFIKKDIVSRANFTETTKKLLGFMLRYDGTCFPFGDSIRELNKNFLQRFFGKKAEQDIFAILAPYSLQNGAYTSEQFFAYRGGGGSKF